MKRQSLEDWIESEPYWRDTLRFCSNTTKRFVDAVFHCRRLLSSNRTLSWHGSKNDTRKFHVSTNYSYKYPETISRRTVYDTISFYKEW